MTRQPGMVVAVVIRVSYTLSMTRRNGQEDARHGARVWPPGGDPQSNDAAIYCRKSKKGDRQQISVTRQKNLALKDCEELGLTVSREHIYVDNGESAWQRNRKRPGWEALLEAARRGEIKHIVCYHPDRLMRQPHDLEQLLSISDAHGILLYGRVNRRNLQDPDDRYALRIEVAHACRSSDDTSRRMKDERQERAENGLPRPGGVRRFGYTKNGKQIIEAEAEIIREIFRRFISGDGTSIIRADLNLRKIKTAYGRSWSDDSVRRVLDTHYVAGIRVHRGQEIGAGSWPAIIDPATWALAREMREFRSASHSNRPQRFYLLRGAVLCGKCGTRMTGNTQEYKCSRKLRHDALRCSRGIGADRLEEFVEEAAIRYLTALRTDGRIAKSKTSQAQEDIADDEKQLDELNAMWTQKEITTREFKQMRAKILARIESNEKKTTVRPIKALEGLTGPNARKTWGQLSEERKNSVIRLIFTVRIGERTKPVGRFDYDRIEVEENELG